MLPFIESALLCHIPFLHHRMHLLPDLQSDRDAHAGPFLVPSLHHGTHSLFVLAAAAFLAVLRQPLDRIFLYLFVPYVFRNAGRRLRLNDHGRRCDTAENC